MKSGGWWERTAVVVFAVGVLFTSTCMAQHETVLHSFGAGTDGQVPYSAPAIDDNGNLFGTTNLGGLHQAGTVFELSPRQGGGYTETVLHSFGHGSDGSNPDSGVILDGHGNLFGTANGGGDHDLGVVFELSPREGGGYTEIVVHSFGHGSDGADPLAGLAVDGNGNLFGTTLGGGLHGSGTVFALTPREGGGYHEAVLHSFGHGTDGRSPEASVIVDAAGNIFGTTFNGGIHAFGAVFELSPQQSGGYHETLLHSFGSSTDGRHPWGNLAIDGNGNLYGLTTYGGTHSAGTLYELSPREDGGYSETVLHSFGDGMDGAFPFASGVIIDSNGNLYGTTFDGGIHGFGTVFEFSPRQGGGWHETILHSFRGLSDGAGPYVGVSRDNAGNVFGTTSSGGIHTGRGVVFEVTP